MASVGELVCVASELFLEKCVAGATFTWYTVRRQEDFKGYNFYITSNKTLLFIRLLNLI